MIRNTIRLALIAAAATGGVMALIKTAKTPPLEAEYKRLYRLVGELPVTDPTRAWMVKLPNDDRLVHQWRVYLPAIFS